MPSGILTSLDCPPLNRCVPLLQGSSKGPGPGDVCAAIKARFDSLSPNGKIGALAGAALACVLVVYVAWPSTEEPAYNAPPPPLSAAQSQELVDAGYSTYADMVCVSGKTFPKTCQDAVAELTSESQSNSPTPIGVDAMGAPSGDEIQVFPFQLEYKQAQCFCQALDGGHLAHIHTEAEYATLEVAALKANVKTAFFLGGYEVAEGVWTWTDPRRTFTPSDQTLINQHSYFDNNGGSGKQPEDAMAYCGHACRVEHGWTEANGDIGCEIDSRTGAQSTAPDCQPINGIFDWGSTKVGGTFAHFACRWTDPHEGMAAGSITLTMVGDTGTSTTNTCTSMTPAASRRCTGGEQVTVAHTGAIDPEDWVGIYKAGHVPGQQGSDSWEYHTSGASGSGPLTLDLPTEAGEYFMCMFSNDAYRELTPRITFYIERQNHGYLTPDFAALCPNGLFGAEPLASQEAHRALERITKKTATGADNVNSPVTVCNPLNGNPTTKTIAVYPVWLDFSNAECFCKDLGGHLAKIQTVQDFAALEHATLISGVTAAVFIGAHEIAENVWHYTDNTPATVQFSQWGWCARSTAEGYDVHDRGDCCPTCQNGIAQNNGQNEDTLAYCGQGCIDSMGTGGFMRPGLHDWGNSIDHTTVLFPACSFETGKNPVNPANAATDPLLNCGQTAGR